MFICYGVSYSLYELFVFVSDALTNDDARQLLGKGPSGPAPDAAVVELSSADRMMGVGFANNSKLSNVKDHSSNIVTTAARLEGTINVQTDNQQQLSSTNTTARSSSPISDRRRLKREQKIMEKAAKKLLSKERKKLKRKKDRSRSRSRSRSSSPTVSSHHQHSHSSRARSTSPRARRSRSRSRS